eukprot:CAMPEP_0172307858 /NCGR_PEP_ID=MMETSP1058-20130122/8622_1 /TAXON_ID=83371 /ORGANISM="Detonula confervacea, Strain CCMP 353" /LENGTH=795 /DNA_ID=CAMNT_0013020143 /DNA_START=24 /DNA_END=2408 /DNA_ORIENTATION=+
MNTSSTSDATSSTAAAIAQAERLQGERFLQLSQSCHEQNWAQVHALAEQIELHKQQTKKEDEKAGDDTIASPVSKDGERSDDCVRVNGSDGVEQPEAGADSISSKDNSSSNTSFRRSSREGTVSISGEVMKIDTFTAPNTINGTAVAVDGINANNNRQDIDNGELTSLSNHDNSNSINNSGGENRSGAVDSTTIRNQVTSIAQARVVKQLPAMVPRSTPRLLSTCLGTASPLAWTCRYSAPSCTVKLVLDLDLSAVRKCLPQLGTPLHECVGRPRPLRKMPLKRGRWSNLIGNDAGAATTTTTTTAMKKVCKKGKGSKKKKKNKNKNKLMTPRILSGLREWRRTVRTLIQADETLTKEDAKFAALQQASSEASNSEDNNDATSEEWRRNVQTMIKDNVTNIQEYKDVSNGKANNNQNSAANMQGTGRPGSSSKSPLNKKTAGRPRSVRAMLAQDADGNTPLHFMIRGAAAPAFGGGRWQARHEVDEEESEDEDDDDDDDDEAGNEGAMDVDSSAGEETPGRNTAAAAGGGGDARTNTQSNYGRDLRHIEYGGTSGSSWDGVRWCMGAHLRRVERRVARQIMWKEKMKVAECDEKMQSEEDDVDASDGERGVASARISSPMDASDGERGVASARIGSPPMDAGDEEMQDAEDGAERKAEGATTAPSTPKLPAKRKSSLDEFGNRCSVKSSRRGSSSLGSPSCVVSKNEVERGSQRKRTSSRKKYFDADECQDCCYDPLLGAVRDLVHSCPEAVGIPDHREYEETPLIVALKSSIYVVMEPDNDFQLVDRMPGVDGM